MLESDYMKETIFRDSVKFIRSFCETFELNSEQLLASFSFDNEALLEKKYSMYRVKNEGDSRKDPDNFAIVKSIYICLWGHLFDIKDIDEIGTYGIKIKRPYRGDTMNSYGVIASKCSNSKLIKQYKDVYHKMGNFILIPNFGNVNNQKGATKPREYVQDSFELFLHALECHLSGNHNLISKIWNYNRDAYFSQDNCVYFDQKSKFMISDYFDGEYPKHYYDGDIDKWVIDTIDYINQRSEMMAKGLFRILNGNFE